MTPQELHAAIDARRKAAGLKWWQVSLQADVSEPALRATRRRPPGPVVRAKAEAWLAGRLPGQPREE